LEHSRREQEQKPLVPALKEQVPERGPPVPRDLIDELAPPLRNLGPNVTGHPRDHRILPKSRDFH
jgi:error-prone DNA polymerase